MITARFFGGGNNLTGFCVSGHAELDDLGKDVACAAVSSAVQLTANGITEICGGKARVNVTENEISLLLESDDASCKAMLQSLLLHLKCLEEDYGKAIIRVITE